MHKTPKRKLLQEKLLIINLTYCQKVYPIVIKFKYKIIHERLKEQINTPNKNKKIRHTKNHLFNFIS